MKKMSNKDELEYWWVCSWQLIFRTLNTGSLSLGSLESGRTESQWQHNPLKLYSGMLWYDFTHMKPSSFMKVVYSVLDGFLNSSSSAAADWLLFLNGRTWDVHNPWSSSLITSNVLRGCSALQLKVDVRWEMEMRVTACVTGSVVLLCAPESCNRF